MSVCRQELKETTPPVTPLRAWQGEFLNLAYFRSILSKFYSILSLLTYYELKLVPLQSEINQQYVQRKMEEKLTNYEWFGRFCNNWKKGFLTKVIIQGTMKIIKKF